MLPLMCSQPIRKAGTAATSWYPEVRTPARGEADPQRREYRVAGVGALASRAVLEF